MYEGEIFERCHKGSEWALDVPYDMLKNKNKLSYQLISDYHDPLPYNIYKIGIVEQKGGVFSIISVAGVANGNAYVLIRTGKDNVKISAVYESENLFGEDSYTFAEKGLHGIKLSCKEPCPNAKFSFTCEDITKECEIPVILQRTEDNISLGTGDMIYINQNVADTEEYLCWYVSQYIGNHLTIRPTYRWSGTRVINPQVWKIVTRVLNELDIKYSLMKDGRELPGLNCNPTAEMLGGKNFLGLQNHELDGKAWYWGIRDDSASFATQQFYDMLTMLRKEYPENCQLRKYNCEYFGYEMYSATTPYYPHDVKALADHTVEKMKKWRTGTRHTGPSGMQKYMYQAGFEWIGAETLYSNTEILLAIMRGLAKCTNANSFGVHHAIQWSTVPHDDPAKYRRYRLALYLSYMLGATEINTEEGLWRIEEMFSMYSRFSDVCKEYIKELVDMFKYISTHTRKGKFYTPIALIHGRLDGMLFFGSQNTWGVVVWEKWTPTTAGSF